MIMSFLKNFCHWRTLRVPLLCASIFLCVVIFSVNEKRSHQNNLICKANLQIDSHHSIFRGVVEYKSRLTDGIANLSGYVVTPDKREYTVKRTVLFTRANHGISPVWESRRITVSNEENAPTDILQAVIPVFYLKSAEVDDVDVVPLSPSAYLILKSGVPYLYCNTHTLTTR